MRAMVSHAYYDLATSELHTNPFSVYDAYSIMLRTKTNLKTDQEQFIRSNVPTVSPLISVRPAETLTTRLNEHERATKMVTSTTTSPSTT